MKCVSGLNVQHEEDLFKKIGNLEKEKNA